MSVTELQTLRNERAAEQSADYSFSLTQVAGVAVVYVINHTPDAHGNCAIYCVSGGRCNCGDFIHRCSQVEGLRCKHGVMVEAWLADCDSPAGAPVETIDAPTCHGCGFPKCGQECALCGSSLIAPTLPAATPELVALRARYTADVAAGLWG